MVNGDDGKTSQTSKSDGLSENGNSTLIYYFNLPLNKLNI